MPANVHPSANDLLEGLRDPNRANSTLGHIDGCLACRVRLARIRHAVEPGPAATDVLQRIAEASTPLPEVLASLTSRSDAQSPRPNEIWRVGKDEALLVWVRRIFEDGVVDVIPIVLDVELADEETILVGADATPLAVEAAVMVSLRTHLPSGVFLNRIGFLNIANEVGEVMAAVREGRRPHGVRVGLPINSNDDQRLEFRQAIRDMLAEISPSAWSENHAEPDKIGEANYMQPDSTVMTATSAPSSMALELERYHRATQADPASDFNVPPSSLATLSLCSRPRRAHYAADLAAIAVRSGVETSTVANLLRAADAVTTLAARRESSAERIDTSGLLVAARDYSEEFTELEDPGGQTGALPGWLIDAVDRFWGEAESSQFPRDLHLPILVNLPIAIIEIGGLTIENLDRWLQQRHLPQLTVVADRPLRGCLVAYGGIGVLFVDRSDNAEQRRLTLAHEAAHFIIDYLIPRENVVRRRPDLLAVLDGERQPSYTERFDALLADVPVGFHTHLLERDIHGGHVATETANIEDRAERLALELLAPLHQVLSETALVDSGGIEQVLRQQFGLPAATAARYANHLRRNRDTPPRTLMEAIGLGPADDDAIRREEASDRETGSWTSSTDY